MTERKEVNLHKSITVQKISQIYCLSYLEATVKSCFAKMGAFQIAIKS